MVNSHKGQLTEWVFYDLERQSDEWEVRIGFEIKLDGFITDFASGHFAFERAWQVPKNRVEQELNTFVFVSRAAEYRGDLARLGCVFASLVNQVWGYFLFVEELFHQFFVEVGEAIEHFLAHLLCFGFVIRWDFFFADFFAVFSVEEEGFHRDQIDNAVESFAGSDRDLHHDGVGIELVPHLLGNAVGVSTRTVHFVDESQARHTVASHLAIDGQRLALNAADGAQNEDRSVENAKRAFDFDGKVDVARGVDQIDDVIFPLQLCGSGGDGDSSLLFELHVIHGRAVAIAFDFFDFMDSTGVEENAFAEGGFTRVDVSADSDVA